METKRKLLGKTPDELKEIAVAAGLPPFAGKQIAQWLYQKKVRTIGEMTNLSKTGREALGKEWEVGVTEPSGWQLSSDGTRKYLFPVTCSKRGELWAAESDTALETSDVEAVMIPEDDRKTLCVSSQAGCKMGCLFCMTGRQGFHGNLSPAEIISQFISIQESDALSNAVFMGMGEPLDNFENVKRAIEILTAPWGFGWSPKRITLSSVGVLPNLRRYLDETRCHLAISMHNPFGEERGEFMKVEKSWPIKEVLDLIRQYDFTGQRRVSFEYTMFSGWNDDKRHADAIIRLLRGLECRVNLIRFHQIPDFEYVTSPDPVMERFRQRLEAGGLTATIRASRGQDIYAACGMLAGAHKEKAGK